MTLTVTVQPKDELPNGVYFEMATHARGAAQMASVYVLESTTFNEVWEAFQLFTSNHLSRQQAAAQETMPIMQPRFSQENTLDSVMFKGGYVDELALGRPISDLGGFKSGDHLTVNIRSKVSASVCCCRIL
ncbi:MAG: hypothetical protein Q8P67_04355 [archaeon]|nr:hypothetical protein [archaeon]